MSEQRAIFPVILLTTLALVSACDDGGGENGDVTMQDLSVDTGADMPLDTAGTSDDVDSTDDLDTSTSGMAVADAWEVYVGPSASGPWELAGSGTGPDSVTVPAAPNLAFRFVRIVDTNEMPEGLNAGANIDAVVAIPTSGADPFYAITVERYEHGGGMTSGDDLDPAVALGAPDAYENYPDLSTCSLTRSFVSLGGTGGELVLGLKNDLAEGDTLDVLEVGDCVITD